MKEVNTNFFVTGFAFFFPELMVHSLAPCFPLSLPASCLAK